MTAYEDEKRKVSVWWERYEHGRDYQSSIKMTTRIPRCVDFYEGRQYPPMTMASKDIPRPVTNFVKMICRSKKANILSTTVRCVYRSPGEAGGAGEGGADVTALNDFSEYISREMREEDIQSEGVLSGLIKGTAVFHYYWDAEARGLDGRREGGLRCELVDPLHVFFEDPTERDEQKQGWILFATRVPVDTVREKADAGVDKELIVPDDDPDAKIYKDHREQEGSRLCTLITAYFRRDGEVMVETAVKACVVNAARPITPDVSGALEQLAASDAGEEAEPRENEARPGDPANAALPDEADRAGEAPDKTLAVQDAQSYLYPVVVWQYEPREGSIYGLGEVENLIPNQRTVNEIYSLSAYAVKLTGWPKVILDPAALAGQKLTNAPGQQVIDFSRTGRGIKYLEGASVNTQAKELADAIISLTRTVSGATEVMTGETSYANMSGAAIAQLQSQAQVPLDDIRASFWRAVERAGRVKAQFFRTHYAGYAYSRRRDTERDPNGMPREEWVRATFDSRSYATVPLECVCEASTGTRSSAAGDIQILEAAYKKGEIDLETLIRAYPPTAIGQKEEILEALHARREDELAQLRLENQQLMAQLQAAEAAMAEQQQAVESADRIIRDNQKLRGEALSLYAESTAKIDQGNAEILAGNAKIAELTEDATAFAELIAAHPELLEMASAGQGAPVGAVPDVASA